MVLCGKDHVDVLCWACQRRAKDVEDSKVMKGMIKEKGEVHGTSVHLYSMI